jgi:aminopeptidase
MNDPRLTRWARLIVEYSITVKPGDLVAITARPPATPLIEALYIEILKAGGHPHFLARDYPPFLPGLGNTGELFLQYANGDQLEHVDLFYKRVIDDFDGLVTILSDENLSTFAQTDQAKLGAYRRAHKDVSQTYVRRMGSGELKRLLTLYPTDAAAQAAEMNTRHFEDFVYKAMYLDQDDPVAFWRGMADKQQRIVDWLNGKDVVEIKGPNVDLTMSIKGRVFKPAAGKINMPDGEIYTGPVEESANGWVAFSYPNYGTGREISGIEFTFKDGKVVDAKAEKNLQFVIERLDTDQGARYLGELGIGFNDRVDRLTKEILFDEKMGGTIHLAIGRGYPDTGSKNESAIHWDLLCDMKDGGQIIVDGELIYESGQFKI